MDSHLPEYELYAIRYAERDARRADHFIGGDPHDAPMPMDYFVWAAVSDARAFVIDTGFTAETAAKRNRTFLRCPIETLRAFDVNSDAVEDVKDIGTELDAISDRAEFGCAFEHADRSPPARERKRGCQSAEPAPGDQDGLLARCHFRLRKAPSRVIAISGAVILSRSA